MENTNNVSSLIQQATEWVGALWAMPVRVVLFALCIVFAQLLKKSPKVQNWFIPWACTTLGGFLSWVVLSEIPNAAATIKTNILTGCLTGYVAHVVHYKILANPESKVPLIGGVLCGSGDTTFLPKDKA